MPSSRKSKSLTATSSKSSSSNMALKSALPHKHSMNICVLATILYHLLVIMYMVNLEDASCGCVRDWRHDYIKYFSSVLVVIGLFTLLISFDKTSIFAKLMRLILAVASIVNIYCLFTYIGELDVTRCACAVEKQKKMHYFLYLWRYILVIYLIIAVCLGVYYFLAH